MSVFPQKNTGDIVEHGVFPLLIQYPHFLSSHFLSVTLYMIKIHIIFSSFKLNPLLRGLCLFSAGAAVHRLTCKKKIPAHTQRYKLYEGHKFPQGRY